MSAQSNITGQTEVLAVFGDPVGHSLSPVMHNGWIGDHGLDAVYIALPLKSADTVAAFRAMRGLGLKGANVTVPHKEAAAAAADVRDAVAERLRAANTLIWRGDQLEAYNTDHGGFARSLEDAAPAWRKASRALIIGAGGAARAVAYALAAQDGLALSFINRTPARGQEAAAFIAAACGREAQTLSWEKLEQGFANADLIVNATSLGMSGMEDPDWPIHAAPAGAIVCDAVYRPLQTKLLRAAQARGLICVDGLGMLIHQGVLAFELWFGIKPDAGAARARLLAALGEAP